MKTPAPGIWPACWGSCFVSQTLTKCPRSPLPGTFPLVTLIATHYRKLSFKYYFFLKGWGYGENPPFPL